MNTLQTILLGIIQGLTEFLPVSSSGHLVLSQHFLGLKESGDIAFEVFLHFGTLLAVLVYYRKVIGDLIISLFRWAPTVENQAHRHNRMLILYLFLSTCATGVIYVLFGEQFKAVFEKPLIVAFMLIITGILVYLADVVKDRGVPAFSMGFLRSIMIGIGQGIAIMPGISRSGTTISASLLCGVKRRDAAQYSFLLSIPAILAANLSEVKNLLALDKTMLISYLAGMLAAFVSGFLVISLLIRMIQTNKLKWFAFYCWIVAIAAITAMLI